MPLDLVAQCAQCIAAGRAAGRHDDVVLRAVRQEDRQIGIGRRALSRRRAGKRQIARQAHRAGQPFGVAQRRHQRHRTALRKAHQHDALRRHAALALAVHQGRDGRLRGPQASLVLAPDEVGAEDVVPGPHHIAAVDRHRPFRRMREHIAHRPDGAQVQLATDGHEVMPVGAQAVQHDDGRARVGGGLDLMGWQHGVSSLQGAVQSVGRHGRPGLRPEAASRPGGRRPRRGSRVACPGPAGGGPGRTASPPSHRAAGGRSRGRALPGPRTSPRCGRRARRRSRSRRCGRATARSPSRSRGLPGRHAARRP
mmetsp:Transcript_40326/g.112116  ORF Transcript_40326/g.112116 Transcript_40326/m.112116 type:complete len:310 (-) Transcript_40326:365-1294(-)